MCEVRIFSSPSLGSTMVNFGKKLRGDYEISLLVEIIFSFFALKNIVQLVMTFLTDPFKIIFIQCHVWVVDILGCQVFFVMNDISEPFLALFTHTAIS